MTTQVNIHEAKTTLSALIQRALAGEEVIIAKAGSPLVRLTPILDTTQTLPQGGYGIWKGKGWVSDDFDEPDPEFMQYSE
jgi:prevent-host-death family protein